MCRALTQGTIWAGVLVRWANVARGFLMEELLEYCEGRFETLELGTANPEYYEPFGFRIVPEHCFVAKIPSSCSGAEGFRPFDLSLDGELTRLDRLLTERTPVSHVAGVVNELDIFKFSQGRSDLHYCRELDCFAVFERIESRLALYDVIARELPPFDRLLSALSFTVGSVDEVGFYFSPDRFDVDARPELFRYDDDHFMVRGPFGIESDHFMIPRSSRH